MITLAPGGIYLVVKGSYGAVYQGLGRVSGFLEYTGYEDDPLECIFNDDLFLINFIAGDISSKTNTWPISNTGC